MKYSILLVPDIRYAATASVLEKHLTTALGSINPQGTNICFTHEARDWEETLIGGVVAACSYGWMNIKILWVAEDFRGRGIGRDLMQHAHRRAETLGCHSVWLDTSNRAAKEFYETLGYHEFGLLANQESEFPPAHRRWFMKRKLLDAGG